MFKKRRGVSLIELVLTLALIGLVLQVGLSVFSIGSTSHGVSTNRGFSQQDVRLVGNFITNELKNVTDISDSDEYIGTYYSLSVIEDVNTGQKRFVKHKLIYTGDGDEEDKSSVTTKTQEVVFTGNWDTIRITSSVMGEIFVEISQSEGQGNKEATYGLPITISTVNKSTLYVDGLDIELVSGDTLYYSNKSLELLTRGIEIGEIPTTPAEVKIDFYSDGTIFSTLIGTPGTTVIKPSDLSKEGYSFVGWNPEVPDSFPMSDMAIYAQWVELTGQTSTISMYVDGALVKSISGVVGSSVPPQTNPTKNGKSFADWDPTLPEVFPDEDLRVDATWVNSVSNLQITKVTSKGTTINIKNGAYKIGNNVDVTIILKFDYLLPRSNLRITTTAFEGSFIENENQIEIKGYDVKPNNSIDISIKVSEIANPNNFDEVSLTLTKN